MCVHVLCVCVCVYACHSLCLCVDQVLDTSRLWRVVAEEMAPLYPEVTVDFMYVDNACMQVIQNPSAFDVVVTENMFGDILSDCASVLPGSLGLMGTASLGPNKMMFEPAGGTAFDLTGKDLANPIAQILSAALMLRYAFDADKEASLIELAVRTPQHRTHRTRRTRCTRCSAFPPCIVWRYVGAAPRVLALLAGRVTDAVLCCRIRSMRSSPQGSAQAI